jgi:GH24 family phage-related lysozyme (muramidase)
VCYGSTTNVQKGVKYSLDECKARLDADMLAAVQAVDRCAPGLPVPVLAAFGDAVYNIGPTVACDTSQCIELIMTHCSFQIAYSFCSFL